MGIFQAAWTITNSYVLILLNAIATDFYPALSSVNHDNNKMNVMINQQTQLSVIIGTPMLILMIVFMPIIMRLLYTTSKNCKGLPISEVISSIDRNLNKYVICLY